MALVKIEDYYPGYRDNTSEIEDIHDFNVYVQRNEKVGSVTDILIDEDTGRLRYLVVDTGFWIFGKKVLLPVGLAEIHYTDKRINAKGLTKQQVESLPNFDNLKKVDYDYEERVRDVYRGAVASSGMNQPAMSQSANYDRSTYSYEQDPSLYNIPEGDGQTLKLYEERLVANKQRQKSGEVAIGKRVESETARVSIPLEKEQVVIERTNPTDRTPTTPSNAFREGEVVRMDVYEETPDIHKEAVVREEVQVKKVVEHDTAEVSDKIRREELDINSQGSPTVDKRKE